MAAAAMLGLNQVSRAGNAFVFDTTALEGNSDGPFYLDFQMTEGDSSAGNTATLSNFSFGSGGSAGAVYTQSAATPFITSPANEPAGGASGTAVSQIVVTDDPAVNAAATTFNELIQAFTPGDKLTFSVALTSNLVDTSKLNPDEFSFQVLDHTGASIPTTSPDGLELLTGTFGQPQVTIAQYRTTLSPTTAAPLPASGAMALAAALLAAGFSLRARGRMARA